MENRPTLLRDIVGFCQLQELDPLKSNDFNKVMTFLKRTSNHEVNCTNLILSITSLSVLSQVPKSSIHEYKEFFFDPLLITILSMAIRLTNYPMFEVITKPPYDDKKKLLTVRGILNEFYDSVQSGGDYNVKAHRRTHFAKIVARMNLTVEARLHLMSLLAEYGKSIKSYAEVNQCTYYWKVYRNSKHNGRRTDYKSSTGVDRSYTALMLFIVYDMGEEDFSFVFVREAIAAFAEHIRAIRQAATTLEETNRACTEASAFFTYLKNALSRAARTAYGKASEEDSDGKVYRAALIETCLDVYLANTETIEHGYAVALNQWQDFIDWQSPGRPFYDWIEEAVNRPNITDTMKAKVKQIGRNMRFVPENDRMMVGEWMLVLAQREGSFKALEQWLRDFTYDFDQQERVMSAVETAMKTVQSRPDLAEEFHDLMDETLKYRISRSKEVHNVAQRPTTMSHIQRDPVASTLLYALGAILYDSN